MPSNCTTARASLLCSPHKTSDGLATLLHLLSLPSNALCQQSYSLKKKKPKQVKETNKKTPIAPQGKEKQAAEIVKQPKLWSLKQLIVNENKHIQGI